MVKCLIDGTEHHFLEEHLRDVHNMSLQEYVDIYPNAPIASDRAWEIFESSAPPRTGTSQYKNNLSVGEISFKVSEGSVSYRFKRPQHYVYPRKGKAGKACERLARAIKYGRHVFVYGSAGTGKSACVRALGHDLNRECSHYPMREGLDPEIYIGRTEVVIDEATGLNITRFQEGKLLQDLRGRKGADGVTRGVLILIDDIDRGSSQYHEILRHVLEDNARSIFVPEIGVTIDVHEDTVIIATANSRGQGDNTGMYASVREMDGSILDRFQRVIEFHFLEEEEESLILRKKFSEMANQYPSIFDYVMRVSTHIRTMIANDDIFASFSHRRIVQWLYSIEELIAEKGVYDDLYKDSSLDWMEWYDQETRDSVLERVRDLY